VFFLLGVGVRREVARRFINWISALQNQHGERVERLDKDKGHSARRFINAEILMWFGGWCVSIFMGGGLGGGALLGSAWRLWGVCGAPFLI
jgi:hypothetical protein